MQLRSNFRAAAWIRCSAKVLQRLNYQMEGSPEAEQCALAAVLELISRGATKTDTVCTSLHAMMLMVLNSNSRSLQN